MSVTRETLSRFLNDYLNVSLYDDYCPNGLQIEGKKTIKKACFAVSATLDSIEKAVKQKADALIVHHGLIWKLQSEKTLTGPFAKRIFPLIQNNINLLGYHLPLDGHQHIGNAAVIAKKLGLLKIKPFCTYKKPEAHIGVQGTFKTATGAEALKKKLEKLLNHPVIISSPQNGKKIKTMGIVTGGASSFHNNSYLTGEISEHDWHESSESGIHMFAGGHNATEEFGIKELMKKLKVKYNIETSFISSSNPV